MVVGFFLLALTMMFPGLFLRGGAFHNSLVLQAAVAFRRAGFAVWLEHPLRLRDGCTNVVDILACRGPLRVICEIETTPRNVLLNASKAGEVGLPLLIVVPTRRIWSAVASRLDRHVSPADRHLISILLPDQLVKGLTNFLSCFSSVNETRKTRKTSPQAVRREGT